MHCILCIVAMYNFRLISAQVLDLDSGAPKFDVAVRHRLGNVARRCWLTMTAFKAPKPNICRRKQIASLRSVYVCQSVCL